MWSRAAARREFTLWTHCSGALGRSAQTELPPCARAVTGAAAVPITVAAPRFSARWACGYQLPVGQPWLPFTCVHDRVISSLLRSIVNVSPLEAVAVTL